MKEDRRLIAPNKSNVDWCIVYTALPVLLERVDDLTVKDTAQTNAYVGSRLGELRMALATIAGSLGILGPDWLERLRAYVKEQGDAN